jgi:catechol-2,3-dioxygenase
VFRVLQIDHVELFVPDMHEAADWYARVLGLQILTEYEHWATGGGPLMISSDGGSTKLALFEGQTTPSSPTAAGFLQRLPELGLADAGSHPVTSQSVIDHQQAYSIYFVDPYGHLLEVTTYDYDDTSALLST